MMMLPVEMNQRQTGKEGDHHAASQLRHEVHAVPCCAVLRLGLMCPERVPLWQVTRMFQVHCLGGDI